MNNKRCCEICDVELQKRSYCRHLRSGKHIKTGIKMLNPNHYTDKCFTSSGNKNDIDIDRIIQLYSKLAIGPNQ